MYYCEYLRSIEEELHTYVRTHVRTKGKCVTIKKSFSRTCFLLWLCRFVMVYSSYKQRILRSEVPQEVRSDRLNSQASWEWKAHQDYSRSFADHDRTFFFPRFCSRSHRHLFRSALPNTNTRTASLKQVLVQETDSHSNNVLSLCFHSTTTCLRT